MIQVERIAKHITAGTQRVPSSVISWTIVPFILLLCASAVITILIVARIWYLSPRKRRDALQGINFPTSTGRAAIVITIESGMLYLIAQLIYCVVFVLRLPSQNILAASVIQIYVRIHLLKRKLVVDSILYQNHTGHRTDTDLYPHV